MSIWQLSWNPKNYNAIERLQLALQDEKYKTITQSWGRSSTKNISKIKAGDVIYISCAKKCVAKGIVSEPFTQENRVIDDPFIINKDERDDRHKNHYYCKIILTDIYAPEDQKYLPGNQNTFCNPTNAFWK